jgi:hypothetical protein
MKKHPLPHQDFLYLIREPTGYRFVNERTGDVVLQLEFVLADSMREFFEQLFADRMHDGYLQLTEADIADIRKNHKAQLVAA